MSLWQTLYSKLVFHIDSFITFQIELVLPQKSTYLSFMTFTFGNKIWIANEISEVTQKNGNPLWAVMLKCRSINCHTSCMNEIFLYKILINAIQHLLNWSVHCSCEKVLQLIKILRQVNCPSSYFMYIIFIWVAICGKFLTSKNPIKVSVVFRETSDLSFGVV